MSNSGWQPLRRTPFSPLTPLTITIVVLTSATNAATISACAANLLSRHGCGNCTVHVLIAIVGNNQDTVAAASSLQLLANTTSILFGTTVIFATTWASVLTDALGIASTMSDYVILWPQGADPVPGWLTSLVKLAENGKSLGAVGSTVVYETGILESTGLAFRMSFNSAIDQEVPLPVPLSRGHPMKARAAPSFLHALGCNGLLLRGSAYVRHTLMPQSTEIWTCHLSVLR